MHDNLQLYESSSDCGPDSHAAGPVTSPYIGIGIGGDDDDDEQPGEDDEGWTKDLAPHLDDASAGGGAAEAGTEKSLLGGTGETEVSFFFFFPSFLCFFVLIILHAACKYEFGRTPGFYF